MAMRKKGESKKELKREREIKASMNMTKDIERGDNKERKGKTKNEGVSN